LHHHRAHWTKHHHFIDSGTTWTAGKVPDRCKWVALTQQRTMVADYIGVSYVNGSPFGVFAVAQALSGTTYNESMFTTKTPLPITFGAPIQLRQRSSRARHQSHQK
jgi:hypothetical protein